jgi:hypothetical protein
MSETETKTETEQSPPTPEHVQQACGIVNSIERNLIVRLADIESTMQPAAIERLRFHIITALGDHIEAIAKLAARSSESRTGE